jgi:hypothetical protein
VLTTTLGDKVAVELKVTNEIDRAVEDVFQFCASDHVRNHLRRRN